MGLNVIRVPRSHLWAIKPTSYSPRLKHAVRSIPGMVWDSDHDQAVGYVDAVDATVRRLAEGGIRCNRGDLPTERVDKHLLPASYVGLREYQKEALDFVIANGPTGALLALDMGCGKSAISLRGAKAFKQKTIIVCLSFGRGVWFGPHDEEYPSQIEKFWPEMFENNTQVLAGVKEPAPIPSSVEVVIVHYDILYAHVDVITKWVLGPDGTGRATIIIDEIHACSSSKARRSQVVRDLAHAICSVRIGLSGTPMTNRPIDLHFPLEILSPGRFGTESWLFGKMFCDGRWEEIEVRSE